MSLFKKIKKKIQQNIAFNNIMDNMNNLDEVLLEKRLEIFSKKVTPTLAEIGLTKWNGKYIWFSDFNEEGIKHVVQYNVSKHFGGMFSYGNCYSSVPTFSGSKLINHRTDKSTIIHYDKRMDGTQRSLETKNRNNPDKISTVNEEKFHKTLDDILLRNKPKLDSWFQSHKTLEQNIVALENDIEIPPYTFGQKIISSEYMLSFLNKQKGDIENAERWMNKHFEKDLNSKEEINTLTQRLKSKYF